MNLVSLLSGTRVYLIAGALAIAGATGAFYVGNSMGYTEGRAESDVACAVASKRAAEQAVADAMKGVAAREKRKQEINRLSDPELDARLDRWMRQD